MAIELLTDEYWNGSIERLYRHDLEAFIWILPFVFLRYQHGKSQQGTLVDRWMTSDYIACRKKKNDFQRGSGIRQRGLLCQSDFKHHWELAACLLLWSDNISCDPYFEDAGVTDNSVASIWSLFVKRLMFVAKRYPAHLSYVDKLVDDLGLENLF